MRVRPLKDLRNWLASLFKQSPSKIMGMGGITSQLTAEQLDDYVLLTYLNRVEINYIFRKFCLLGADEIREDINHRFSAERICHFFPALKYNPFSDRIFRVFSDVEDGSLNFEEFLNLCSVFSINCPLKVKAAWAFLIYDFDEDQQISKSDIAELLDRLTQVQQLTAEEKDYIGNVFLQDMDLQHLGGVNQIEFLHAMSKLRDLPHAFSFKP